MIIELDEQTSLSAVAVKKRANKENFVALIHEGFNALNSFFTKSGKQLSDAPYIAYYGMGEEFDIEIGFPVAEEVPVEGELYMSKTYGGRAVTGMHKGSYDGLEKAYGEIFKYMEENALEPAGVFYDFYLNDPTDTQEDELLTKIVISVK